MSPQPPGRLVELRVDAWSAIDAHDAGRSEEFLAWADVVICEWCAPNPVWYSRRKRPGQRLLIRLHRFELYRPYARRVAFEIVDRVVFVGEHYRQEAIARLAWPAERLVVIPNWVDTRLLDRPKVFGAFFNLGMIGIAPRRKRLDRGLTVLERLRVIDDRLQLYIKSKLPWQYPCVWQQPEEQDHYRRVFSRMNSSAPLAGAVHFGYDIYTARADGANLRPLAPEPGYDADATVSPRGDRIVFTSVRNGDLDLYSMNLHGSDLRQLTNEPGYDGGAFFSWDGKKIVYRAWHETDSAGLASYRSLLAQNLVRVDVQRDAAHGAHPALAGRARPPERPRSRRRSGSAPG